MAFCITTSSIARCLNDSILSISPTIALKRTWSCPPLSLLFLFLYQSLSFSSYVEGNMEDNNEHSFYVQCLFIPIFNLGKSLFLYITENITLCSFLFTKPSNDQSILSLYNGSKYNYFVTRSQPLRDDEQFEMICRK